MDSSFSNAFLIDNDELDMMRSDTEGKNAYQIDFLIPEYRRNWLEIFRYR